MIVSLNSTPYLFYWLAFHESNTAKERQEIAEKLMEKLPLSEVEEVLRKQMREDLKESFKSSIKNKK